MARGIPKSTKEFRPVATLTDTDEIIGNAKIAGKWYTIRIAVQDFLALVTAAISGDSQLCDWPNCDADQITTGATFGDLYLYNARSKGLNLVDLEDCTGDLVYAPRLDTLDYQMSFLTAIAGPFLTQVGGSVHCVFQKKLITANFNALTSVGQDFKVAGNSSLLTLAMDVLNNVGQDFDISANLLTAPRIPATVGRHILVGGSIVTSVDVSGMVSWGGNFNCQDSALTEAAVNAILVKLDSLGVVGRTILLNLGTSAAPSGAGATAKTSLIGAGNTVTTN